MQEEIRRQLNDRRWPEEGDTGEEGKQEEDVKEEGQ
jgi:hypothetical protein